MNTQTFLNILKNNLNKELLFEYAPDKFVSANYHITEIKNLTIDAVDCGGKANSWKETVVQLWENPLEIGKRRYMTTTKAVEIFDRVNSINPLLLNTLVKIEYGNRSFHTAHLKVHSIGENDQSIIVKLHADSTQCKAASTNICCTKKNIEKAHSITKEPVICC
jgi:hypothetical protein